MEPNNERDLLLSDYKRLVGVPYGMKPPRDLVKEVIYFKKDGQWISRVIDLITLF